MAFIVPKFDSHFDTPNGSSRVEGYGKLDLDYLLDTGERMRTTLHDVVYVPEFNTNRLFSLNSVADRGSYYHGTSEGMKVKDVLLFDPFTVTRHYWHTRNNSDRTTVNIDDTVLSSICTTVLQTKIRRSRWPASEPYLRRVTRGWKGFRSREHRACQY